MRSVGAGSTVELDELDDAAILHVRTDMDGRIAARFTETLAVAVKRRGHVVLDLADVATVDSDGLSLLVRAHRMVKQHGRVLCLAAPSRYLIAVLHTMHLHQVFPMFDDCSAALHWLRHGAQTPTQGVERQQ